MVLSKDEAEKKAKEIFNLNDKIRFIAFTSKNKLVFHSMREGIKSYTPNEVDVDIGEVIVPITVGIFEKTKDYFGNIEYLLIKFEKVNLFVIPFSKGLMTITTEPDYEVKNLAKVKEALTKL